MGAAQQIISMTALELGAAFGAGDVTPVEAAGAVLEHIEERDAELNGFCLVDADTTLSQARAAERRLASGDPLGPLDGVPVAVKDVFLTAGWPTLKGSRAIDPAGPWDADAPAVARLREAGAVFPGKTTTPELGWKGITDGPLTGVTRNPWDPSRTPGGSSGGSAAALAAGMCPLALGTDGGGSIRIPGGFTGIVGLKPTFGRVPHWPISPFGTLSHAGPMARTVTDVALLFDAIAQADPRDWTALPPPAGGVDALESGVDGLRIAFSPTLGYVDFVDPEIADAVSEAVGVLESLGAEVEEVDPGFRDPRGVFEVLWYGGAASALAGIDPSRRSATMDDGLLEIAEAGARLGAVEYLAAAQQRNAVATRLSELLADHDLLVTPTLPIPAFEAGLEVPPGWPEERWHTWTPFSLPFNLSQQPALTVPCGTTDAGLPIGLQIVAAKHRDGLVLRAGRAYEEARTDGGHDQFTRPKERT